MYNFCCESSSDCCYILNLDLVWEDIYLFHPSKESTVLELESNAPICATIVLFRSRNAKIESFLKIKVTPRGVRKVQLLISRHNLEQGLFATVPYFSARNLNVVRRSGTRSSITPRRCASGQITRKKRPDVVLTRDEHLVDCCSPKKLQQRRTARI